MNKQYNDQESSKSLNRCYSIGCMDSETDFIVANMEPFNNVQINELSRLLKSYLQTIHLKSNV